MRTTLNIDDDVLERVKVLANSQGRPLGEVMSELARRTLERPQERQYRNGVPLLPSRGGRVTLDMVNRLRDEDD
ncbi:ribbon-helix-helix protein, CopG family [Brevundimonas sp.]|jgi:hypothetical protein|uniref:ribbon-helix-helix protein, CopG family n=1 Tax=Brevundimonas sp. TaxID=1871086 RepID=UPI0037841655